MRVKICGITNPEDAHGAIDAGADALGFNLWPGSKRHILLDENAAWMTTLSPFVTRVAVLVNASFEEARRVAAHPAIDLVQFHGDESRDYLLEFAQLGHPFIVAIRLANAAQAAQAHDLPTRHLLIDAEVPGSYGGTGKMIDFPLARAFMTQNPQAAVILAGGLNPENVGLAIAEVRPFAVDVASGVEASSRRKDPEKMRSFIAATQN